MSDLVSVVIPAYKRPEMLADCLASVLSQDYRPLEVVVTDDSPDAACERVVEQTALPEGVTMVYRRSTPSLRQAGNVNKGFALATGDRIVLIHDDDVLLPGCISALSKAMDEHPEAVIAYGRQRLLSADGSDRGDSQAAWVAEQYGTAARNAGLQPDALASALRRQVPNNGYMVKTEAARAVGYRPESEVGHVCDFDFGVRLAQRHPGQTFLLIDRETSAYRLTPASVSRGSDGGGIHLAMTFAMPSRQSQAAWRRRLKLMHYDHSHPALSANWHLPETFPKHDRSTTASIT